MICFGSAVSEFPEPLCYHHHVGGKRNPTKPRNRGQPDKMPTLTLQPVAQAIGLGGLVVFFSRAIFFLLFSPFSFHFAVTPCPPVMVDICCSYVSFENELPVHWGPVEHSSSKQEVLLGIKVTSATFSYWKGWSVLEKTFDFVISIDLLCPQSFDLKKKSVLCYNFVINKMAFGMFIMVK